MAGCSVDLAHVRMALATRISARRCSFHPNFDPIALQIGPLAVRWYGLMYLIAFLLLFLLGAHARSPGAPRCRRGVGVRSSTICSSGACSARCSAGGWAMSCSTSRATISHIRSRSSVWQGGMSFHGGCSACSRDGLLRLLQTRLTFLAMATSSRRWCRWGWRPAAWATSSTANSGGVPPTCPGRWCFRRRATASRGTLAALPVRRRGPDAAVPDRVAGSRRGRARSAPSRACS
jgi:hypothetical protein